MKKVLTLALALALLLFLTACGGKDPPSGSGNQLMDDLQSAIGGNSGEAASDGGTGGTQEEVPQETEKPIESTDLPPAEDAYENYGLDSLVIKALRASNQLASGVYELESNTLIKYENGDIVVPEGNFIKALCGTDYYQLNIGYASYVQLTDYALIQYLRESHEMISTKLSLIAHCAFFDLNNHKQAGFYTDFQDYLSESGYSLMEWNEAAPKDQNEMYELKSVARFEDKWRIEDLDLRFSSPSHKYAEGSIAVCAIERASDYTKRYVYPVESLSATLTPDCTFEQVKAIIDAMRANGIVDEPDKGVVIDESMIMWHGRILVDTEILDDQSFECYNYYKLSWMPSDPFASVIQVEYYYGYIYV